MAFNYKGAKEEGYSDDEIAAHLAKKHSYNLDGARQEGYSSTEIIQHLLQKEGGGKGLEVFPSYERPPAEVPTSTGGFIADLAGGILETPANLAGQAAGVIGGGVNAAGHALAALAAGVPVSEAAGEAFNKGMHGTRTFLGTMPETYSGQRLDETMTDAFKWATEKTGEGYEKAKRGYDLALLEDLKKSDPEAYKRLEERVRLKSGEGRRLIEGGAESLALIAGARGAGKGLSRAKGRFESYWEQQSQRRAAELEAMKEAALKEQGSQYVRNEFGTRNPSNEGLIEYTFDDSGMKFSEKGGEVRMQTEGGRPTKSKPINYTEESLPDPRTPEAMTAEGAIDAQTAQLYPKTTPNTTLDSLAARETPAQLQKMNRASEVLPENPSRPFYGDERVGLTRELPDTRYDLSRTQVGEQPGRPEGRLPYRERETERGPMGREETPYDRISPDELMGDATSRPGMPGEQIPGIPFEPNRPFTGREPFAAYTGWQVADPRVAEAIAGDSYLKGMQTRLGKMEENLKGIGEMQSEVQQRYGTRRVEGGSGQQIGKELVAFTKSMKAVERDITKLRESIDKRVKMHEERVRKSDKYERLGPDQLFPKAKKGTNRNVETTFDPFKKGPGRRQAGAINPEVFRQGFEKVKELLGGRKMVAYATRDEYGPVFRVSTMDQAGRELGSADFIPTRGGLKRLPERDLISALTEVDPEVQRQGIATEMYKFAQELGNDIVPSTAQTLEGKAMWEGFNKKGLFQGPGKRQRGAVDFGISKKVGDMIDSLRRKEKDDSKPVDLKAMQSKRDALLDSARGEERPLPQAVKDIGQFEDLPGGLFEGTIENLSNAQTVYNNTRNPFVKYISDYAANAKQQAILMHELMTQGIEFGKGLLPKKIINKDSPFGIWRDLSKLDRQKVTDIINLYNGKEWPTLDTVIAMGGKEKHYRILEKLQAPIQDLFNKINAELQSQGMNPIPWKPFYFMKAQGFGPWLVRIKDSAGETVAFHRMETAYSARKLSTELQNKFKGEGYDIRIDMADKARGGNKWDISTTLLEEVYHALEKADPRREAITSAISEIKSKGGFAAHRARRKDVKGMELSSENFWKTYDSYMKDGSNYIANLKLGKMIKDLPKETSIPPNTRKWAINYLNMQRGGFEPGWLPGFIEWFSDGVLHVASGGNLGPGTAKALTRALNQGFMTSVLFFGNIPFLVGSALQSTAFSLPTLSNYKYIHGYKNGSMHASFINGSARLLRPDKEFSDIVSFLTARGKLDPTLVSEISVFGGTSARLLSDAPLREKAWSGFKSIAKGISGEWAARHLESMGRIHAASIGMDFLQKQGLKGKELKLGVERFVDDVMGNYSMTDRPGIVSKTGILGETMRPLSTFKNWFVGTTAVMMKEGLSGLRHGNPSKMLPLATMWMSTAIFGGLMGAIGFKELDMLYNLFKDMGWLPWAKAGDPSLTEILLRSNMLGDAGKLGVITGATKLLDERGIHIAGSMASPEVLPSVAQWGFKGLMPGVGFGVDIFSALTTLGGDATGLSKATVEEKRKALKQIMPGIADKILNNLDSQFDDVTMNPAGLLEGFGDKPVPGGKRGYGTVRRDGWETAASIVGAGTIPEVKEKTARQDLRELRGSLAEKKAKLVDLGVDAINSGKTDLLANYAQRALEMGFQDYLESLQTAMMKRLTTEQERQKVNNPRQLREFEYILEATRP